MSGLTIALIVIVVIVVILAIALIGMYNNLVRMRNRVDNAWAQVDVQLQRRLDLIPNLVETVKGYASHESGTLQAVTEARTAAMSATTPEARAEAESYRLKNQEITQETLAMEWINKWDGKLPSVASDGSMMFDISDIIAAAGSGKSASAPSTPVAPSAPSAASAAAGE